MKKQHNTLKEITQKVQRTCISDKKMLSFDSDVPPPKKEKRPVPPPNFTLEQLLTNIP